MPGVVDKVDAADIPGTNNAYGRFNVAGELEKIFETDRYRKHFNSHSRNLVRFCSRSPYAGFPVGLILADSFENARAAARAVVVSYANQQPPVLTIEDALAKRNKVRCTKKMPKKSYGKRNKREFYFFCFVVLQLTVPEKRKTLQLFSNRSRSQADNER